MALVLISTSDVARGRSDALDRMLCSVAGACEGRPGLKVHLLLLMQNYSELMRDRLFESLPAFVHVEVVERQVPLSSARNLLLARAFDLHLIGPDSVVLFPDDDCWYPDELLAYLEDTFAEDADLDFWFCGYDNNPVPVRAGQARPANVCEVIRQVCSITMVLRGRVVHHLRYFDESFGVGTPLGGGEDTEFALSAFQIARRILVLGDPCVGHRRDPERRLRVRGRYFGGTLLAIAGHAGRTPGVMRELARKLAVGGWLTLNGELSVTKYIAFTFKALSKTVTGPARGKARAPTHGLQQSNIR